MFAELLSHSEEIIFLEAIDQYFELNTDIEDSLKEESKENLENSNNNISDILNDENDLIEKENEQNSTEPKILITPPKYLVLNEYIIINKNYIDELKANIYESYKSQIEKVK